MAEAAPRIPGSIGRSGNHARKSASISEIRRSGTSSSRAENGLNPAEHMGWPPDFLVRLWRPAGLSMVRTLPTAGSCSGSSAPAVRSRTAPHRPSASRSPEAHDGHQPAAAPDLSGSGSHAARPAFVVAHKLPVRLEVADTPGHAPVAPTMTRATFPSGSRALASAKSALPNDTFTVAWESLGPHPVGCHGTGRPAPRSPASHGRTRIATITPPMALIHFSSVSSLSPKPSIFVSVAPKRLDVRLRRDPLR